jgi:hypothetical protein
MIGGSPSHGLRREHGDWAPPPGGIQWRTHRGRGRNGLERESGLAGDPFYAISIRRAPTVDCDSAAPIILVPIV